MNSYLFISITFFVISILTANYKTKNLYSSFINTFFIFLYLSITIMYFSADYFTGKGITQAVLFTLETGMQGAGFSEYAILITMSIFLLLLIIILSYYYLRFIKRREHPKPKRIKGIIHNTFLLFAFLAHPFDLDMYSIYTSMHIKQSADFDKYYKKPDLSAMLTKDYNLVYIYAESLEKTFFDENIFPGLMKNIKELKKSSTEFTNINQVVGTGWTIGGMVSTQCGIPLFTPSGGSSMGGLDDYLSGAICLGDILKSNGYYLTFMQGSSIDFSGIRQFYTTHKFDEILGFKDLNAELRDKNYRNGWGLYDDTLLPLVYKKFEALSKKGDPFALFMITLDTHPDGMPSKSCKDISYDGGKSNMLKAVHCSDLQISKFIKKIQNSKYADKTLIVLTSDHLAMRNSSTKLLKKGTRKDLFLIFDPAKKYYRAIAKEGSMLDVGSTVLGKLGINTKIGLGRNLLLDSSLISLFDNFDKKALSWRKSILEFWKFPVIGKSYVVNTAKEEVHFGNHSYKLPMLARIGDNGAITPLFEFASQKKLVEYADTFSPKEKFIWIDTCRKLNFVFDLDFSTFLCSVQGSLSSKEIYGMSLENEKTTIYTNRLFSNTLYSPSLYERRICNLRRMSDFKNLSRQEVALVSSRMPIVKSIPSTIAIKGKIFQLSRGLNILSMNHNGNYSVQNFDVYGSQSAADKFAKTVESYIERNLFWAVVASDAIRNIYPEYKEKLTRLGFKLLPTLDLRVAYVAYVDSNGTIHEFSDNDTFCKIIPNFVK